MQSTLDLPFWKPNWFCDNLFSFSDHFDILFNSICEHIFASIFMRVIPLYFLGSSMLPLLKIGTILPSPHAVGYSPFENNLL